MRGSCLFKVGIFLLVNLIEIQGDNMCTSSRSSGLLSNILGIGTSDSKATDIFQCCINLKEFPDCPEIEGTVSTGSRVTVLGLDSPLQRNFVNRLCPVGYQSCEYDQNQVDEDPSIEDKCITPEKLNEFAACQQGCPETGLVRRKSDKKTDSNPDTNEPDPTDCEDSSIDYDDVDISAIGKRTDAIRGRVCPQKSDKKTDSNPDTSEPNPGDYPDGNIKDYVDYDDISIAAFGKRTDAIRDTSFEDLDKQCGTRDFQEKALPDNQAALGEFPWACSVYVRARGDGNPERYLGGCVIVPNSRDNSVAEPTYRVVTAASKMDVQGQDQLKVRIRYTNLADGNFEEDYTVANTVNHPDFDKKRLSDNIAVMFLEKPLDLIREDGVNAACLPACNNMFDHTFVNKTGVRCWSAGFGAKEEGGQQTFVLAKTDIPIFPDRAKCETEITKGLREKTGRPRLRPVELVPGELCAGGEPGKDTCSGDGGSPLVCQAVSGRWHVVGLVSWGIGCGVAGRPAIYTNVFHYLDWIYRFQQDSNGNFVLPRPSN